MFKYQRSDLKDVLELALPAVGENILYMMVWVFDTMMVGRYGGNVAVSSVGLGSEFMYGFSNIFIAVGIGVGITSLVARRVGANLKSAAEEYLTVGFIIGGILSFIGFLIFFLGSSKLLSITGADDSVIAMGTPYMRIASIGIFFNMLMILLNSSLRGYGNTKTPLVASILINIVNITLDYALIFGNLGLPELGVRGAAIATTIAQFLGFLFILNYVIHKSPIKPRIKYVKKIKLYNFRDLLRLSIPSSMQEAAFTTSRIISNLMVISMGTVAFAANQITTTIESISFMPGWGFAVAATTLVGHKVGEGNLKKAEKYARLSMILGTSFMIMSSLLFLIVPNGLIKLFISPNEVDVINLGTLCLMIAAIEQPFMAISMIVGGAFKGLGNTKTPFKVSIISSWIIRLPLMYIVIYKLHLNVTWVWVVTSVQWIFDGSIIYYFYKKNLNKNLVKQNKVI
ncbi:MATE family efflux transporter [Clostridium algidicarnis]|uniref:MATE family efflux transporter n=1 Tax=Clostridium algidicarnis TaxID=37659 RepID=UPI003FD74BFF